MKSSGKRALSQTVVMTDGQSPEILVCETILLAGDSFSPHTRNIQKAAVSLSFSLSATYFLLLLLPVPALLLISLLSHPSHPVR